MDKVDFNVKGYELKLLKMDSDGGLPGLTVERWKNCCIAIIVLDEPDTNLTNSAESPLPKGGG